MRASTTGWSRLGFRGRSLGSRSWGAPTARGGLRKWLATRRGRVRLFRGLWFSRGGAGGRALLRFGFLRPPLAVSACRVGLMAVAATPQGGSTAQGVFRYQETSQSKLRSGARSSGRCCRRRDVTQAALGGAQRAIGERRIDRTGSPGWIRTTIDGFRVRCPAVRRPGNFEGLDTGGPPGTQDFAKC